MNESERIMAELKRANAARAAAPAIKAGLELLGVLEAAASDPSSGTEQLQGVIVAARDLAARAIALVEQCEAAIDNGESPA